jgi:hypothetical protein
LNAWKNAVDKVPTKSSDVTRSEGNRPDLATTLHTAEAFALVMLCHIRLALRKLALNILKEVKQLFKLLGALREDSVSSKFKRKKMMNLKWSSKFEMIKFLFDLLDCIGCSGQNYCLGV